MALVPPFRLRQNQQIRPVSEGLLPFLPRRNRQIPAVSEGLLLFLPGGTGRCLRSQRDLLPFGSVIFIFFRRIGFDPVSALRLPDQGNDDVCRIVPDFLIGFEDFRFVQVDQLPDRPVPDRFPFLIRFREDQFHLDIFKDCIRFREDSELFPVQAACTGRDRLAAVIAEIQSARLIDSVCGQFCPVMLTDVQGDIIGHGGLFVFTGHRSKVNEIAVRMGETIAQERPVAGHFIKASPLDKIVIRIGAACLVGVQLFLAVFVHPGNTVRIVVPGFAPASERELPHEIGITHVVEELQGLFLVRAVG